MEKVYEKEFNETIYFDQDEIATITIQKTGSLLMVLRKGISSLKLHLKLETDSQSKILLYNQSASTLSVDLEVEAKKDAKSEIGFLDMEESDVTFKQKAFLKESGADIKLMSAQLGQVDTSKLNDIEILHEASHTFGYMENFSVLFDRAHYEMVANGNIQKGCYGSQSHQTTRVLTLGKDHKAQVIPLLLIDENDVKASHAQTIGQPDEEQLYYLKSRGLSQRQAMGLLSIGYLLPILELVSDEATKEKMREEMESKVGLYGHGKNS